MSAATGSRRLTLTAALVVAAVAGACSSTATVSPASGAGSAPGSARGSAPAGGDPVAGSITVAAASSLTEPFTAIGSSFEATHPGTHLTFTFDSSSSLVTQITGGAPVDVFAAADTATMQKLADADLVGGSAAPFARNELAIVVKHGNPTGVRGLADLARVPTLALCGSGVPCGTYADQVLRRAGVTVAEDHLTRAQNAKATLTAVADGDADAGIVYITDVKGDKVEAVPIPDDQNAVATYPIAPIRASTNAALAASFVAYVTGPDGQRALQAAGFLPP